MFQTVPRSSCFFLRVMQPAPPQQNSQWLQRVDSEEVPTSNDGALSPTGPEVTVIHSEDTLQADEAWRCCSSPVFAPTASSCCRVSSRLFRTRGSTTAAFARAETPASSTPPIPLRRSGGHDRNCARTGRLDSRMPAAVHGCPKGVIADELLQLF